MKSPRRPAKRKSKVPLEGKGPPIEYSPPPRLPGAPPRIVVITDNPLSRKALVGQLKALGLDPLPVRDSLAALNAMDLELPDMVLIDLVEQEKAVYQAVFRVILASRAKRIHLPVLGVIGLDGDSWLRSLEKWVDGALARPLSADNMHITLAAWLDLPPPPKNKRGQYMSSIKDFRLWAQARLAEDVYMYEQGFIRHDSLEMKHFSHRAKGAALVLKATRAAELADRVEQAARGNAPLTEEEIRETLAALKEAVAAI